MRYIYIYINNIVLYYIITIIKVLKNNYFDSYNQFKINHRIINLKFGGSKYHLASFYVCK